MQIRDRITELRRVRAADLIPNPRNWRTHPKHQADALKGLLAEVGYADALIARELPGDPSCLECDGAGCDDCGPRLMLVDGHLRAETTPEQEVPVLVLDVTEAEADKILATLDPLAALAGSDTDLVNALLADVETSSAAVQEMLDGLHDTPEILKDGHTDPDDVPETPADPITQPGDIWLLGEHRVMCGDSTRADQVDALLVGAEPFMMVTDPPYGVEYTPNWRNEAKRPDGTPYGADRIGEVKNDDRADWTEAWALFPGDVAYVWHASLFTGDVARSLADCDLQPRAHLIWAKPRFAISRGHYHWQHEMALYAVKKGRTARWGGDRSQSTLWQIPQKDDTGGAIHGTQKPVECMERPIRNHGKPGDGIYDPFLGSGTTLIACERTGRTCYGMELDPVYCDVIVQRWEAFTGQKAKRS